MTAGARVFLWLVLTASVVAATPAAAQQPTQSEMLVARRLFRSGLASARAGEWEDARRDFERSYGVAAVPTTLLNLAGAQVQTGRLVAGMGSYQRFLQEATSGRAARYRGQAEDALAALEDRLPRVRITAPGALPQDELRVDGDSMSMAVLGDDLPLDPGEHAIRLVRRGTEVARAAITLSEGDVQQILLEARATPSLRVGSGDVEDGDPEETFSTDDGGGADGGLLTSPWFWIGAGVLAVGAVVVVVLLAGGGEGDLYSGNFGPGHVSF